MRRVICDEFEFNSPDSEQTVELAIASKSPYCPDLTSLLSRCGASAYSGSQPPVDWPQWPEVAEHLNRFAALELPHPSQLSAVLLRNNWDDVELAVEYGSVFVWYHWSTTA